jgi:uncharacterized protein (DUF2141 family)
MPTSSALLALLGLLTVVATPLAQPDAGAGTSASLVIEAEGFTSDGGHALARLYRPGMAVTGEPWMTITAPIVSGRARLEFPPIPVGDYAAVVAHDRNDNGRIDHRLGFPSEPLGFSNGFRLSLFSGLPTFERLRLTLTENSPEWRITVR